MTTQIPDTIAVATPNIGLHDMLNDFVEILEDYVDKPNGLSRTFQKQAVGQNCDAFFLLRQVEPIYSNCLSL